MPTRRIHVEGQEWSVYPSGQVTQYDGDEFGLLLFYDEIHTGFGRTGKLWGYDWSGVKPDVAAIAKSDDPDANVASGDPWQKTIDDLQQQLDQGESLEEWLNRPPDRKGKPPDRPGRKHK